MGPHGVCKIKGLLCHLPPQIFLGKYCIPPNCTFPIYKWTSLESTAPRASKEGRERMQSMKRVCPGTGAPVKVQHYE